MLSFHGHHPNTYLQKNSLDKKLIDMRKVRRRKNHMNIMVINEEKQIEIVHVPNHLSDEYIKTFNLMTIPTKDELYDFLLDYNSLRVK